MRLSGAMTRKFAVAGLPFGGGKAVIAVPELPSGAPRRELFLRYGELVDSLGGTFRTSLDMNTGVPDLDVIGERTEYVFGKSVEAGGSGSPSPPTAMGVFHGIRASLEHAFGSDDPAGRTVAIQGAGGVGDPLAGYLADAGATVLVGDIDPARARGRRAGGWDHSRRGRGARSRMRRLRPVRRRGCAERRDHPPAPVPDRRGLRQQPACRSGGGRPSARARDPLRARLRHQRRWSHSDRRPRAARLESGRARRGARESAGRCRRSSRRPRHRGSRPGQPPRRSPTSG